MSHQTRQNANQAIPVLKGLQGLDQGPVALGHDSDTINQEAGSLTGTTKDNLPGGNGGNSSTHNLKQHGFLGLRGS